MRYPNKKLAIHGGTPVRKTMLPYGHQSIEEDDIRAVVEVLRSDWITTGPKVAQFEEAFAECVGAKYAVSFSSGTAALHGAAYAARLGPGDEAITTPLTFCATANCVLYQGATPVFADVSSDTLTVDPDQVALRITQRTKAILPVDYGGHPVDLNAILSLAEQKGLMVIEHITTGEGGMVATDNQELADRLRLFRTHGIDYSSRLREDKGQWYYEMVALGYNYRLTDIGCVLGLSQLRRLEANLSRRRAIADSYTEALRKIPGVIPPTERPGVNSAWHLYPIRLELEAFNASRLEVFRALRAENIGVNVHYIPVHLHPYYRERFGYQGGEYPVAEHAYEQLISLPMFHSMTDRDVEDVIQAVSKVMRYYT